MFILISKNKLPLKFNRNHVILNIDTINFYKFIYLPFVPFHICFILNYNICLFFFSDYSAQHNGSQMQCVFIFGATECHYLMSYMIDQWSKKHGMHDPKRWAEIAYFTKINFWILNFHLNSICLRKVLRSKLQTNSPFLPFLSQSSVYTHTHFHPSESYYKAFLLDVAIS